MTEISTKSTSLVTAEATPITLRETSTTRWVFVPLLVDNPRSRNAAVKGSLVYQRKGKSDAWERIDNETLATLKVGQSIGVHLNTEETRKLFAGLSDLYALHMEHGIPKGEHTFVSAEESLRSLVALEDVELERVRALGSDALARLLRWAAAQDRIRDTVARLENLGSRTLYMLSQATGLQALKKAAAVWDENQETDDEEFWQRTLLETPVLIEQLFAYPVVLVREKAYLGGKRIDNTGGSVIDYLAKNRLTKNAVLIEIKTPCTPLVGSEYRTDVFPPSREVAGAMTQVLDYRRTFTQTVDSLARESREEIESCDPPCLVIAGNVARELSSVPQRRCFELFRRQLRGVEIISFDELFGRTARLVALLEGGVFPEASNP